MLILRDGDPNCAIRRWLKLTPARPALLTINATAMLPTNGHVDGPARHISRCLATRASAAVLVDLERLRSEEGTVLVTKLLEWLAEQPIELVEPNTLASQLADELFGVNV